jgi:hypothetical protein
MEKTPEINEKLFYYMVRHYNVFFPPENVFNTNLPHLMVDDKFYQIEGNRKYIKQRIRILIEESKPELFENRELTTISNKTIKEFINSARKITKE